MMRSQSRFADSVRSSVAELIDENHELTRQVDGRTSYTASNGDNPVAEEAALLSANSADVILSVHEAGESEQTIRSTCPTVLLVTSERPSV